MDHSRQAMAWYPHTSYPQAIRTSQREQAVDTYCHAMPPNTRPNPSERLIVYVDGFNLYHGLKDRSGRRLLWLDLVSLSRLLRPRSLLVKVKYFTAPVLDDPPAASRQARYQRALVARNPGLVEITQGRYQKKARSCRACGASWIQYEEKETDVSIATTMVADAARGVADSALIISADSDLSPAVRTARLLNSTMFMAAAFPPKRYSAELRNLMPASFSIGLSKLTGAQLPRTVVDPISGRSFSRPSKWT
ncbi:NYN domain-containing protein [Kribbella qitaiheensis]|uniref:NYN domain-containing protein n=1 Tax=Kribbella qitaiheensis TaxID=1544730 RepID=UPI00361DA238